MPPEIKILIIMCYSKPTIFLANSKVKQTTGELIRGQTSVFYVMMKTQTTVWVMRKLSKTFKGLRLYRGNYWRRYKADPMGKRRALNGEC